MLPLTVRRTELCSLAHRHRPIRRRSLIAAVLSDVSDVKFLKNVYDHYASRRHKGVWRIVPTVGWIHRSLLPAQLSQSQICCQSSEINLLTRGKNSEAGSFIGVTESERAAFAAVSAFSLPLIPR